MVTLVTDTRTAKRTAACLAAALALVPAMVKLLCYPHNIGSDDAYIHIRIATNFIHGLGWGINPRQPVNLSTSPAFTLLLACVEKFNYHAIGITQLLSGGSVVCGLIFIFLAARAETHSLMAAFLAETAAAFSVNLWRWNGALMEASFAFAVVAAVLYLFRREAPNTLARIAAAGIVLGVGVLLRPEMGLLIVLGTVVQWMRSSPASRVRDAAILLLCVGGVVLPWCVFARLQTGSIIPTTFAAKSTPHLIFLNVTVLRQFAESIVESILFPTLLILLLLVLTRGSERREERGVSWLVYLIPAGWVMGLVGFYYLKTPHLQSAGRYVLPLLPCEVMLLALMWHRMEASLTRPMRQVGAAFVGMHVLFSIGLNAVLVMPVLQRFEPEYATTMRAAAGELARRLETSPNRRVLVKEDIGVLSCAAQGRFEIFDAGSLATPSLRGLSVRDQIERVQPAFVVESLSMTPAGLGPRYADLLEQVWERRFRPQSVSSREPYFYAIVYQGRQASTQSASR